MDFDRLLDMEHPDVAFGSVEVGGETCLLNSASSRKGKHLVSMWAEKAKKKKKKLGIFQ